jgi:hypothetical protein
MTLILVMVNRLHSVLVSDRRLTSNGKLKDDEANKASLFVCQDARLAVAYTVLAEYGTFQTRFWLPTALVESAAPDFQVGPTIERFRERATRDFAGLKLNTRDKRFTVVLAGYYYGDATPRCCCWQMSNFEGIDAQEPPLAEASDEFKAEFRGERPASDRPSLLLAAGEYRAVSQVDFDSLGPLVREYKPANALVGKAVEVIHAAADSSRAKGVIGKQCTSIVLPSKLDEQAVGEYHSATLARRRYFPSFIKASESGAFVIADPEVEVRGVNNQPIVLSVPKVGRNHVCPCGSGLKFKKCHGLSRGK